MQEEGALKQAHQKQVNGFFNAAKLVYQLGGVRGFFQVSLLFLYCAEHS